MAAKIDLRDSGLLHALLGLRTPSAVRSHPRLGLKLGFEFKFTDPSAAAKSLRVALADLKLKQVFVVYPGARRFELDDNLTALLEEPASL